MRWVSRGWVGMYKFMMRSGVRGLFLIFMAWRYGDIQLGVVILVMFSLLYITLGIMVSMPPLAWMGPAYLLFL